MEVETYAAPGRLAAPRGQRLERKIQRLTSSGLRSSGEPNNHLDLLQQVFGPPLSRKQLRTWRTFLPKAYSLRQGEFRTYAHDEPPRSVVRQIDTAKSMSVFNDVEIWTPEGRYDDPTAVGVIWQSDITHLYFPIVRWAESLVGYEKIVRKARLIRIVRVGRWAAPVAAFTAGYIALQFI